MRSRDVKEAKVAILDESTRAVMTPHDGVHLLQGRTAFYLSPKALVSLVQLNEIVANGKEAE